MAVPGSVTLPQTRSLLISMIPDTIKSNVDVRARQPQCCGDTAYAATLGEGCRCGPCLRPWSNSNQGTGLISMACVTTGCHRNNKKCNRSRMLH